MKPAAVGGLIVWSFITGTIAKNRGRSFWGYFLLSFLISPLITMIIVLCMKKIEPEAAGQAAIPERAADNASAADTRWAELTASVPESLIASDVNTALSVYNRCPTDDVLARIERLNPEAAAGIRSVIRSR